MRNVRLLVPAWLAVAGLTLAFFQNCGKVAFQASEDVINQQLGELLSLSSVQINDGDEFTREQVVRVGLFAPRATEMKLSNDPQCTDGSWEPFSTSRAWTLASLNRDARVFAQFKDGRGQISDCTGDGIMHDDQPPEVAFTNAADFVTNLSALKVEWSASDKTSGLGQTECADVGGQPLACQSALSVNVTGDGTKNVVVKVTDKAGNSASYRYAWLLDQTPPSVVINSTPAKKTKLATADFAFTGADSGSGVARYFCRKGQEAFAPCDRTVKYAGVTEGDYTFDVYAVDKAGNKSEVANAGWSVVMRAPSLAFSKTPDPITNAASATFEFAGLDATQPVVRFECALDGSAFATCVSPRALNGLAQGVHKFEVRGFDEAGNDATIQYQWNVDLTPPTVSITSGPSALTNSTSATFGWMVSDNVGVKSIECRVDATPYAICPATGRTFEGLGEGSHRLDLRVTDTAGNQASVSRMWVVDVTPPVVQITSGPDGFVKSTDANFAFGTTIANDAAFFECKVEASAYARCVSPLALTQLEQGGHTILVRATDAAGNVSSPAARSWSVDTLAPTINVISAPAELKSTDRAIVRYEVSDAGSGLAGVLCALVPATPAVCPAVYTADLGPLAAGDYTYQIAASDKLGNSAVKSVPFKVVATPTCKADEVYDAAQNKCVVFACNTFVEITSFPAVIPERTTAGVCYYAKLFDAIPSSNSQGAKNMNVLARTHEGANNQKANANPYILGPGPQSRQFNLAGPRAVKLSGDARSLAPIKIDNFFLIGQRLANEAVTTNGWNAYGSGDSTLYQKDYVLAYDTQVPLQAFGGGGTVSVNALLLTQYFQPKLDYVLDLHALDCGGQRALSEIYLMWQ